jgi:hypothetical protein
MTSSVQISYLWNDTDLLEVRILAGNGVFGGTVDVYLSLDALAKAAEAIDGFPSNTHDMREIDFGPAKGLVSLRFFCEGEAGKSFVELSMESQHESYNCAVNTSPESVKFHAAVEAKLGPICLPALIVNSHIPGMLGIRTIREATPSSLRILRRASQQNGRRIRRSSPQSKDYGRGSSVSSLRHLEISQGFEGTIAKRLGDSRQRHV